MTAELFYLSAVAGLTAMMWIPYILDSMRVRGLMATLDNPRADAAPLSPWADRAKRAHYNAVENLVVFAPLVLAAVFTQKVGAATATAAAVYFWARLAHYLVYTAGVPVARTLAFVVGVGCQATVAFQLLS